MSTRMLRHSRPYATAVLTAALAVSAACGGHDNTRAAATTPPASAAPAPSTAVAPATQPVAPAPVEHHSKLGGAVLGGVVGHMVGGRKGALVGAAAGAYIQHRRNKEAQRAATTTP